MPDGLSVTLCVDSLQHELGGIGRYTWELAQRLPVEPGVDSVSYYFNHRLIDAPTKLIRGEPIFRGRGLRRLARTWRANRALRSTLVHSPNYFLPQSAKLGVVTVHDLSVFRYPDTHPAERIRQFEHLFADSLARAAHIIADTGTGRDEIVQDFGVPARKITSVPLGVSCRFRPYEREQVLPFLHQWRLDYSGYGLCVSALEPRKKVAELMAVWRRLPIAIRDRFPLVLAGGSGWMNEGLHGQLKQASQEGWLRHLGHVSEEQLPLLYSGAALFVYPSSYEGFGLPPIEAMASGVPVIVSNRSCLPEVCGDAALYINPDDDNDFLSAVTEALENSRWRSEATRRGLVRASLFTWERCLNDTVDVYKQAWRG